MNFADKLKAWLPFHRNTMSCALHFLGAYLFILAVLIPLSWLRFSVLGVSASAAMVAAALLAAYVVFLDAPAGVLSTVLLVPTAAVANVLSELPKSTGAGLALGIMVFRFAIVIGGHVVFERKTHGLSLGGPQLFVTEPVYLIAQLQLRMGLRKDLSVEL